MIEGMRFHHIGVACEDINATASHYLPLGYSQSETVTDPLQNIRISFLTHSAFPTIELLAPVDENSPIVEILSKTGTTPYHICYEVGDLEDTVKALRKQKYVVVSTPKVANAMEGNRVAFLYNKAIGLIELVGK